MQQDTLGKSRAAVNLTHILEQQEFKPIRHKVLRVLDKQLRALHVLMGITDPSVRATTLMLWHEQFVPKTKAFPKIIQSHMLSIETGVYHDLLKVTIKSKRMDRYS